MKIEAPTLPAELSFENLQVYKSALRAYDLQRIENGEASPQEVQRQNSVIRSPRKVHVERFPEAEVLEA